MLWVFGVVGFALGAFVAARVGYAWLIWRAARCSTRH